MKICATCGKPVRIKWGSHWSQINHMRFIHESDRCLKLMIIHVRDVIPIADYQTEKKSNGTDEDVEVEL